MPIAVFLAILGFMLVGAVVGAAVIGGATLAHRYEVAMR